jgi:hypothetical protein
MNKGLTNCAICSSLTEINLFSFSEDLPFLAHLVQVFLVLAQKAKSKENRFIFSPSLRSVKIEKKPLPVPPISGSNRTSEVKVVNFEVLSCN